MNARTILNGTLSTVLFAWFLAATLPGMNTAGMSPFQAYVSTPLLMMLAGIGALTLFHALGCAQQWMMLTYRGAATRLGGRKNCAGHRLLHRWLHLGQR